MKEIKNLRFILHVSDFHLTDDKEELRVAKSALKALSEKLKDEKIKIDYLMHTGDIINSSDIYLKANNELNFKDTYIKRENECNKFDESLFLEISTKEEKEKFDKKVIEIMERRFSAATDVMNEFISDLNISCGSVVICSGNHDVLRYFSEDSKPTCEKSKDNKWVYSIDKNATKFIEPFEDFLNNLGVANSQKRNNQGYSKAYCNLGNLNILMLNTNWPNPQDQKSGYFCVCCEEVIKGIDECLRNSVGDSLNIVLAHKPLYEICEKARLSYKQYIKTPFMSELQKFIGENGIYLCGDKHTRSIVGSSIHDIRHYIGGEPLVIEINKNTNIEYNLLEICDSKIGMERKIHLTSTEDEHWVCDIRPQDEIVSKLFSFSKDFINKIAFELILESKNFNSWESICQEIYSWSDEEFKQWKDNLNILYQSICKYRLCGNKEYEIKENIFDLVKSRITEKINTTSYKNILNVRGEYGSGKSTFLGILYIYMLFLYSIGKINYIPAYFNLECSEVYSKIDSGSSYYDAVDIVFKEFTKNIQKIAEKECEQICYIIDGIDEQDCWRYSTEDSIGRCLLNVLSQYENAWHILAFSQNKLPKLKNTMPVRKYNDTSDIMYFNPIDVQEEDSDDKRFQSFVKSFLELKQWSMRSLEYKEPISEETVNDVCKIIRKFRKLTINLDFIYKNYDFIIYKDTESVDFKNKKTSDNDVFDYYMDRQYEICLENLGYGFINYAPAMAYLFAYCGYTYERLKYLRNSDTFNSSHIYKYIVDNYDKVYKTFLFIKKHKDSREYLIALHYNRELRYYAENPNTHIEPESILNQLISRNISILIRKLWGDINKFIIASEKLLQRQDLNNCTLSMLIYCLAHLDIYPPIGEELMDKLCEKGEKLLSAQQLDKEKWQISECGSSDQLKYFVNLSLKHSMKIFTLTNANNSIKLVEAIMLDEEFRQYNRQFQLLYYGDLSINGEDRNRPLIPSKDNVYKGFDFHNSFKYLFIKLYSNTEYPLREYDMFTVFDLIISRLKTAGKSGTETFFFREKFTDKSTLLIKNVREIFNQYIYSDKCVEDSIVYRYFQLIHKFLEAIEILRKRDTFKKDIGILVKEFEEVDLATFDPITYQFATISSSKEKQNMTEK